MVNFHRPPQPKQHIIPDETDEAIKHDEKVKMETLLTPGYLSRAKRPRLRKTEKTSRFHALDMELFLAEGLDSRHAGAGPSKPRIDLSATSVYRTVNVPENYTLVHLAAVSSFLMGWPLETSFDIWLREVDTPSPSCASKVGATDLEVWLCLAPPEEIDDSWTVIPLGSRKSSLKSSIRLSEVWNRDKGVNRTKSRFQPLMKQPRLVRAHASVMLPAYLILLIDVWSIMHSDQVRKCRHTEPPLPC